MSVHATVQYPILLFKALTAVKLNKDRDCWATVIFTDTVVVLHVEGSDQSSTATAMLPRKLFAEYAVSDAKMEVHLQTLMDAMLLRGPTALTTNAAVIRLAYSSADGGIVIELTDRPADVFGRGSSSSGGLGMSAMAAAIGDGDSAFPGGTRVLQSRIVTRPVKDNLLDLHFRDNAIAGQVTLLGDALRDAIGDLVGAQCAEATLVIDPRHKSVRLLGEGSPFGSVEVLIRRNAKALLSFGDGEAGREARTKVSTRHLAVACGASGGGVGGTGGGRSRGAAGAVAGADASGGATVGGGFERLTLQINARGQLSVVHMERDHDVKVTVTVVVNPLFDYDIF